MNKEDKIQKLINGEGGGVNKVREGVGEGKVENNKRGGTFIWHLRVFECCKRFLLRGSQRSVFRRYEIKSTVCGHKLFFIPDGNYSRAYILSWLIQSI